MKQFIVLAVSFIISTTSLAIQASEQSDGFAASMGSAWKSNKASINPYKDQNDLTIVYGGEDVSLRQTLITPSGIA